MALATACGGSDVFPRDEFVSKLQQSGVEQPVALCVYRAIEHDKVVMADVVRAGGPNDQITSASADKLKRIVARCILDSKSSS